MNLIDQTRFFLVYPIGLEDLGLLELKAKFADHFASDSFTLVTMIPGGLEIECPMHIGLNLNTILRTPTRILMRIGEFKCRDAPKLFQKISKFNWAPWLIGQTPEVEIATSNSRLFDSRKIEKAIQDGILQYYRHKPVKKKYLEHFEVTDKNLLPKIYFRSVDDLCTISLDTTGERLHKRGDKILTGLAPIRESLAALLLIELQMHLKNNSYTLIDPMCGSGTFLLEAHDQNAVTNERDFSFKHIPLVLDNNTVIKKLVTSPQIQFNSLLGHEIDSNVVKQAIENCQGTDIKIEQADLFSGSYPIENAAIILNPPYGIRVGEKSEINLPYYLKVIEQIKNKFNPKLLGIIVPSDYRLKSNSFFSIQSVRPFKNGGIEVAFYVLGFK
jgi:putative N6-adenine-specific DNA methylase